MLINIIRWPIQREFEFLGISLFLETLETMFPKWIVTSFDHVPFFSLSLIRENEFRRATHVGSS